MISMGRSTISLLGKGNSLDEVKKEVDRLTKEQAQLLVLKEQTESDKFIEQEAREKLGLVRPGDTVVVLPPEDVLRSLAPSLDKESFIEEQAIWERWSKMFF